MTRTKLLRLVAELSDPACETPLSCYACNILSRLGYGNFVEEFQKTFFDSEYTRTNDSSGAWWAPFSDERPLALLLFAEYYRGNNKPLIRLDDVVPMIWERRLPEHIKEQLPPLPFS